MQSPFRLKATEAPWGDYGRILYHGMSMHQERDRGFIRLERTGPDIFPITFPFEIVVTSAFRREFEISALRGATFVPVVKYRIVELDWSSWDVDDEEPPEYPESGEPEGYILGRPHSPRAADALGDLWELAPSKGQDDDIFHLSGTTITCVSPRARDWFESRYADYIAIR